MLQLIWRCWQGKWHPVAWLDCCCCCCCCFHVASQRDCEPDVSMQPIAEHVQVISSKIILQYQYKYSNYCPRGCYLGEVYLAFYQEFCLGSIQWKGRVRKWYIVSLWPFCIYRLGCAPMVYSWLLSHGEGNQASLGSRVPKTKKALSPWPLDTIRCADWIPLDHLGECLQLKNPLESQVCSPSPTRKGVSARNRLMRWFRRGCNSMCWLHEFMLFLWVYVHLLQHSEKDSRNMKE